MIFWVVLLLILVIGTLIKKKYQRYKLVKERKRRIDSLPPRIKKRVNEIERGIK